MSNLFSTNSPLWRAMSTLADLVWLNILFVLCSIPLITVGASLSAMYSVTLKICANEEESITKDFFKSFRENFKQATVLWLIMLGVGIFLIVDFLIVPFLGGVIYEIVFWFLCVIGILYIMVFSFLFPLQSKFANTTKRMFLNAILMSIRHLLPTTVVVALLTAVPGLIVYFKIELLFKYMPIVFLLLFSGLAFLNSKLLLPIFRKYISLQEQAEGAKQEEEAV